MMSVMTEPSQAQETSQAARRRSVWITDQHWEKLQEQAWEARKSVSELIRTRSLQESSPSMGNHYHFEVQGGVASDAERLRSAARAEQKDSKVSEVFNDPSLDVGLEGFTAALEKLMSKGEAPAWMFKLVNSKMYKAWKAHRAEG